MNINIFDDVSSFKTIGNKGRADFSSSDTSTLAKDLLPIHNKNDIRFQTDVQINGKTRFEESNTIIKSYEEELLAMKEKMSFVYAKDDEIGTLKSQLNGLKKENKELQDRTNECVQLRMEHKQKDLQLTNLLSENNELKDQIQKLKNNTSRITEILTDDDDDSDFEDEYMPINIHHLREVLFNRLRDKQTKHIDKLIHSYNLRKKNMVKKSVLEKMLEEAVCL
jgi:hypothetical protein